MDKMMLFKDQLTTEEEKATSQDRLSAYSRGDSLGRSTLRTRRERKVVLSKAQGEQLTAILKKLRQCYDQNG